MINPKIIVGSAVCGFSLSFLTGLFSGAGILVILLRAVLFAVVFGGISAGIQLAGEKFLEVPQSDIPGLDTAAKTPEQSAVQPGSAVDITIADEDLPKDDSGPQFFVNPSRSAPPETAKEPVAEPVQTRSEPVYEAGKTNVDPDEKVNLSAGAEQAFVPVQLGQQVQPETQQPVESRPASVQTDDSEQLDELPDMDDIAPDGDSSENDDGVIQDSDFASETEAPKEHSSIAKPKNAEMKDTELMTKAIRTVLESDN